MEKSCFTVQKEGSSKYGNYAHCFTNTVVTLTHKMGGLKVHNFN